LMFNNEWDTATHHISRQELMEHLYAPSVRLQ
jgi:hypothetical protein